MILLILAVHIVWIGLAILFIDELREKDFPSVGYLELQYLLPIVVLYTAFLVSEKLFIFISNRMTQWENYKLRSEFESSFILKNYVYQIILKLGFPFFISFIITNVNIDRLKCTEGDCWYDLQIFVRCYLYVIVVKISLFDIIFPFLKRVALLSLQFANMLVKSE